MASWVDAGASPGPSVRLGRITISTCTPSRARLTRPTSRRSLPGGVTRRFAGVELILHAGDLVVPGVLDTLAALAPVVAVRGNNDWGIELPERLVVEVEALAIGLVHIRPERADATS